MLLSYSNQPVISKRSASWLNADLPAWLAYVLSIAIALGFLAYMFPWAMYQGNSIIFDYGDNAQHTSGWWYYAKDTWHFPLLHTSRVDHPEGISIAFTDSIPLAALLFKALMTVFPTWFPDHFHYFGWWIGFVFVTQALSATLLMRTLGAKSVFATVLITLFVLTWPVVHVRYSHAALMLHSILLLGLALYFLGVQKQWRSSTVSIGFVVLHVVALLVHPYFVPFTFGLYVAFMADQALKDGNWLRQLMRLVVLLSVLLAVAMVMGYLGRSTYRGGYGDFYHFNLAAPFCGDTKLIRCGYGHDIQRFEGYNYFGAGLLLLLPIAMLVFWRDIATFPKRYLALFLVLAGLFLYALSNHVWLGNTQLFTYQLPAWLAWITGTFRVAGRYFWLIGYLILFTTLVAFCKKKHWFMTPLLGLALVVQIVDVKPLLKQIKTLAEKPRALNYEEWTPLMQAVDKIVIYPNFDCPIGDLQYYTWIMQLAGYHSKLLNSGYVSRDKKNCAEGEKTIQEPLQARHLYVMSNATYYEAPFTKPFVFSEPLQQALDRGECVKRRDSLMCLPGSTRKYWEDLALNTYPANFAKNSMFLAGPELNTEMGMANKEGFGAHLVSSNPAVKSHLGWAPSQPLPIGKYKFNIIYLSTSSDKAFVGQWNVVLHQGGKHDELYLLSGKLNGTNGKHKTIEGTFSVSSEQVEMPFDIQTYYLAQGDLQLVSIALIKLP